MVLCKQKHSRVNKKRVLDHVFCIQVWWYEQLCPHLWKTFSVYICLKYCWCLWDCESEANIKRRIGNYIPHKLWAVITCTCRWYLILTCKSSFVTNKEVRDIIVKNLAPSFRTRYNVFETLGLYSLSGKTSYRKISWSLEAKRFGLKLFQSLWNLAGTSAALLPRCLSNFRAIRPLQHPNSRLRDFTRFGGKTSYRLVNRGPKAKSSPPFIYHLINRG